MLISFHFPSAVGHMELSCSPIEYVMLNPPSGKSCGDYMGPYMSVAGGYLTNPQANSNCVFCSTRTSDQFLEGGFNIYYSDRWWHLGVFCAFIVFNVSCFPAIIVRTCLTIPFFQIIATFILTWLFRIRSGNPLGFMKTRLSRRK
jgi:ATP-binding cassette, subfamily G (WHITE), member 2, SNQ2